MFHVADNCINYIPYRHRHAALNSYVIINGTNKDKFYAYPCLSVIFVIIFFVCDAAIVSSGQCRAWSK